MRKHLFLLLILSSFLYPHTFYYQNGQKVYLTKKETSLRSHLSVDTFVDEHNRTVGVGDEIIIETQSIDTIVAKYPIRIVEKIGNRFYRCKVTDKNKVFEIAALIYHEEGVQSAHPNFIKEKQAR